MKATQSNLSAVRLHKAKIWFRCWHMKFETVNVWHLYRSYSKIGSQILFLIQFGWWIFFSSSSACCITVIEIWILHSCSYVTQTVVVVSLLTTKACLSSDVISNVEIANVISHLLLTSSAYWMRFFSIRVQGFILFSK